MPIFDGFLMLATLIARGLGALFSMSTAQESTRLSYDALHYQWAQGCASVGLADDVGKPRYTLH